MTTTEHVRHAVEGLTITGLLRRNASRFPDHPALTSGIEPESTTMTWSELRSEVAALASGLGALGLRQRDRMLIAMSTRPEHWIVDLAAIHVGALPCTTYDSLSTEQIRYVAQHSAAKILVLEGHEQMRRWRPVLDELPHLRAIVVDPTIIPKGDPRFISYADLRGEVLPAEAGATFERLTDAATPEQPLTVVYTSGTTGAPKGVVLSHRNVIHESLMQDHLVSIPDHPRSVAYLPLAHIAERVLGIYMPICNAGHVTLCPDQTRLLATLSVVRPNGFFGVPRVWEKLANGLRARLGALPVKEAAAVAEAQDVALRVFRLRSTGETVPADLAQRQEQLDNQVLRPIRTAIGFGDCHRAFSGAAPIPTGVLEFLASVGLPVYEVWGLSETTGAATVSTSEAFVLGAVGPPAPGVEVAIATDGEVLVRGAVVMSGYLRANGEIQDATDEDGWFPTGDIGSVDERRILSVADRKKEIIITDGGKNIAPTKIESMLRSHPLIAQAVAIGEKRRYVTALLVLDGEAAPAWSRANGIGTTDLGELSRHPDVHAALNEVVAQANSVLARAEQVKKYRVLAGPWTPESGELTPKLSLRRTAIDEQYAETIESMYEDSRTGPASARDHS